MRGKAHTMVQRSQIRVLFQQNMYRRMKKFRKDFYNLEAAQIHNQLQINN